MPQKVKLRTKYNGKYAPLTTITVAAKAIGSCRPCSRMLALYPSSSRVFDFPTAGASHYERPLNFHGTETVSQHGNPEKK